jgi:hypothetical protein
MGFKANSIARTELHHFFMRVHGIQKLNSLHYSMVQGGVEHRFEAFSEDFAVWVFFYGPEGGEKNA